MVACKRTITVLTLTVKLLYVFSFCVLPHCTVQNINQALMVQYFNFCLLVKIAKSQDNPQGFCEAFLKTNPGMGVFILTHT